METKLSKLSQENVELELLLEQADREVLKQIVKFLSLYPLSSVEVQILRKDLIGMAQEAKLRGMRFQDVIGEDIQSFCKSVLDNARQDRTEYLIHKLSKLLCYILIWYLGDWGLCYSFPQMYSVKIGWVLIIANASVWSFFASEYFERKTIFKGGNSKTVQKPKDFTLPIFFVTLLAIFFIPSDFRKIELFYVPGFISACALALAAAAARFLYWANRSMKGK